MTLVNKAQAVLSDYRSNTPHPDRAQAMVEVTRELLRDKSDCLSATNCRRARTILRRYDNARNATVNHGKEVAGCLFNLLSDINS